MPPTLSRLRRRCWRRSSAAATSSGPCMSGVNASSSAEDRPDESSVSTLAAGRGRATALCDEVRRVRPTERRATTPRPTPRPTSHSSSLPDEEEWRGGVGGLSPSVACPNSPCSPSPGPCFASAAGSSTEASVGTTLAPGGELMAVEGDPAPRGQEWPGLRWTCICLRRHGELNGAVPTVTRQLWHETAGVACRARKRWRSRDTWHWSPATSSHGTAIGACTVNGLAWGQWWQVRGSPRAYWEM